MASDPNLFDLRVLLAGAELRSAGIDPLSASPDSEHGYYFNYPRVWTRIAAFGVESRHAYPIGCAMAAIFFAFAGHLLRPDSWQALLAGTLLLLSPGVLSAIAMGNNEIVIWLLFGLAGCLHARPMAQACAPFALAAASVLKLLPICGLAAWPLVTGRRLRWLALALLLGVSGWFVLEREELKLISSRTPRPHHRAFGAAVVGNRLLDASERTPALARVVHMLGGKEQLATVLLFVSRGIALLIIGLAMREAWRSARSSGEATGDIAAWYLLGGTLYVAAFLVGSNYIHREVHLLLLAPALTRASLLPPTLATLGLVTIIATMWAPLFSTGLPFLIAQLPSWILLGFIAYSLTRVVQRIRFA